MPDYNGPPIERCKECGGLMNPFENGAYNQMYAVKKWGWICSQCHRVVEEIKPIDGVKYI